MTAICALATALLMLLSACAPMGMNMEIADNSFAVPMTVSSGLQARYIVGDVIPSIPNASITYDGGVAEGVPKYIIDPSGRAVSYNAGNSVALSAVGLYTIKYVAAAGGNTISADGFFSVDEKLCSAGQFSTAHYGKIPQDYYEQYLATPDNAPVNKGTLKNMEGIILNLVPGEVFRYNRVVDLSNSTLAFPAASILTLPGAPGVREFGQLRLRYTDAHDPQNYFEIYITSSEGGWDHFSSVNAGYNGYRAYAAQTWCEGVGVWFSIGANYCTPSYRHPNIFGEVTASHGLAGYIGDLFYDNVSKTLKFGTRQVPSFYAGVTGEIEVGLAGTDFFPEPWGGFTTGEAYFSIEGVSYFANSLNLFIPNIAGHDLSVDSFVDADAPKITADTVGYTESALPGAKVGKPYPVFKASALDDYDRNVQVKTEVYFNYNTAFPILYQIVNGTFTPDRAGLYTIAYTATDRSGNRGEKLLNIIADTNPEFSFTLSGEKASALSGEEIALFTGISSSGARGIPVYTATVKNTATNAVYAAVGPDWQFIPMDAGTYTVTVEGSDYITKGSRTFTMIVTAGNAPMIFDEAVVPRYFIKGARYELPSVSGFIFSSGKAVVKAADIKVCEDGALVSNPIQNGKYTVGNCSSVKLSYTVTDGGYVSDAKEYTVTVVDTGYGGSLSLNKYFYQKAGAFTPSLGSSDIKFTATNAVNGSASLEFINAVQVKRLETVFGLAIGGTGVNSVNVYLTDSADEHNVIKLTFFRSGGATRIRLNNGLDYPSSSDIFNTGESGSAVTIGYADETRTLFLPGNNVKAKTNLAGVGFVGFKGGSAYITIEAEGVRGTAALRIMQINNQRFFNVSSDNFGPQILANDQRGEKKPGTVINLPAARITDVLDPDVSGSLTITAPGGMPVVAGGVTLHNADPFKEYSFTLSSVGDYTVRYTASDKNNTTTVTYAIVVVNSTPPVITLSGIVKEAKVGSAIMIADASVTNGGSPATLQVWIQAPNSAVTVLRDNNGNNLTSFIPGVPGVYTVYYSAKDAYGNFVTESYKIEARA